MPSSSVIVDGCHVDWSILSTLFQNNIMGIHKLTKEKAIVLDDILTFLINSKEKYLNSETHGEFMLEKYLDHKVAPTMEEINSYFYVADTLIKDEVKKPYARNTSGFISVDENTLSFIRNGGFTEIWKDQNTQEEYISEVRKSALYTNNSIQSLNIQTETFYTKQTNYNKWQKILTMTITAATVVYTIATILSYKLQMENQAQEEYLKKIKSIVNNQEATDSLFRKNVQEIFKKP